MPYPVLILGEVSTGLLQHSTSVPANVANDILALQPGQPVRWSTRPIAYAVSPDLLTGVDCRLPTGADRATRCVGTASARASLTGGRVLQGSARVRVRRATVDHRLPWSHYLSRPGVVECIGKVAWPDVVDGFTGSRSRPDTLDLGAVAGRAMDVVQDSAALDRRAPFPIRRTRLRWALLPPDRADAPPIHFGIDDETVRNLVLRLDVEPDGEAYPQVLDLCEDLALHDWLLTTLLELIERSRIGAGPPSHVIAKLKPAVDHLLHLWMPAARVDRSLEGLWHSLERRPGFTRQWQVSVDRVRDQIAVNTIALLSTVGESASLV
jgi:hypothetical protein